MSSHPTSAPADAIDAFLPQTQCRQCGYAGCRPYSEAIAAGRADINRCPPGGDAVIKDLAALLAVRPKPLDLVCGTHKPPAVAVIDEQLCIGCTLCIQACPIDAIVGAPKLMHTVIAAECSGCELCLQPCPVDCIAMVKTGKALPAEKLKERASYFRRRFAARLARLQRVRAARRAASHAEAAQRKKRATIAKAVERARQRLRDRT
jgi:H+/Na+-translocating ferredoxin:NAD+ oxidoreductase subunit B